MKRIPRHIAPFLLVAALRATSPASPYIDGGAGDTTKMYRLGEIVVSAERYPVSARRAGAVSYELGNEASWTSGGPGDALGALRNIHVASYGGGMSLQTLSMRGMGSEHTLMLWNGMPAGNMQTGVSDLNLFNAADLEAVQVVPGSASAIHGSSAVGGVVNLVPAFPFDPAPSLEVGAASGSFGEFGTFVKAQVKPFGSGGLSVRANSLRGRGDYTFTDPPSGEEAVRAGNDYSSRSISASAGWLTGGAGRLGAMVSALTLDQGSPGPWIAGATEPDARRHDSRAIAALSWERPAGEAPGITASAMIDRQYERYLDPSGLTAADNYYKTTWAGISGQLRHDAGDDWLLQAGTDLRIEQAAGNAIDETREREGAALSGSASWTAVAPGEFMLTLTPSIRAEGTSSFRPTFSPRLGMNAEFEAGPSTIRIHSSAASGSRNPTMNELWYSGVGGAGNPDLRGESSVAMDAGLEARTSLLGEVEADVTYYHIRMTDRIQWAPTSNPWVWSPLNIGNSRSTGWEFGGRWTLSPEECEITADYSTIDSKRGVVTSDGSIVYDNQLTYIPLDKGSVGLLLGRAGLTNWLESLMGTARLVYTGERYVLEDNSLSLPGYAILDACLAARFGLPAGSATVRYQAGNITGVEYAVMPGYPMPGFHNTISISWKIGI